MYAELVKRLRNCATQAAPCKTCDLVEDGSCSDTLMKEAADAIEERCQQVDKFMDEAARLYAKLPRWIPVTERLPERCNFYIVADFGEVNEAYYNSDGVWFSQGNKLKGVSHWMPLPEPPKEET